MECNGIFVLFVLIVVIINDYYNLQ